MDLKAVSRLADAEAAAQSKVADHAMRVVRLELQQFDGWYSKEQIAVMANRIGQRVRAASKQAAGLTDSYLSRVVAEAVGSAPTPAGVIRLDKPLRNGVTSYDDVYSRPAETYRYQRSVGLPGEVATQYALQRVDAMVRTDLQLARRAQGRASMRASRAVTGYRRLLRPYASKGGVCGLCVAAADRTYHVKELMPLHERCCCDISPVIGELDPGLHLNNEDLGRLYEAAGSTGGKDLKRVRVRVEEHGELGPQLVHAGPGSIPQAA